MVKDYGEFKTQTRDQDGCKKENRNSQSCGQTATGEEGHCAREDRIQGGASESGVKEVSGQAGGKEDVAQISKTFGQVETGQKCWKSDRGKVIQVSQARQEAGSKKALETRCQESRGQTGAK